MAAEPGGIASKLGGIYERRYAAEQLIRLIAGRLTRLRWEPAPGDAGGSDVEIDHADGVIEHVQLKRQNRADAVWSVAALDREGVLAAAAQVLSASHANRFTFVSSDPVPHLKDICDQLSRNSDPVPEFIANRIHSQRDRQVAFEELLRRWNLTGGSVNDEANAIARLRSMRFVLLDRSDDGRERLLMSVQLALTGDPEVAVAQLYLFLESRLGRDVLQQDALEYLGTHGIRPRDLARDPSLPSAIQLLRDEFRDSLRDRLVAGTWLNRPQVADVVDRVASDAAPRVILIHGKPGAGKSGVLLGITDGFIDRGVPILPLSLRFCLTDREGAGSVG